MLNRIALMTKINWIKELYYLIQIVGLLKEMNTITYRLKNTLQQGNVTMMLVLAEHKLDIHGTLSNL